MPRPTTLEALADLTEEQWGLFTRRQAEATGMAWTTLARLARDGAVERIAHGVYRLRGAPYHDHLELRAAWLQLSPGTPSWKRTPEQGVVSHRSAAALYRLGHLPADVHHFILPVRRQSRRPDVRLHRAHLPEKQVIHLSGLLATTPSRIASDLLAALEDPEAVGQVIADALRAVHDDPGAVAQAIAPHATKFGMPGGLVLLEWLLELTGDAQRDTWLSEAALSLDRDQAQTTRREVR